MMLAMREDGDVAEAIEGWSSPDWRATWNFPNAFGGRVLEGFALSYEEGRK